MGKLKEEHGKYPRHTKHDEQLETYKWCFNNGIKIGPIPLWGENYGKWTVEITMNGKTSTDPRLYLKENIMHKVYEYCDYYYDKYGK